jgi:hypothetical protein
MPGEFCPVEILDNTAIFPFEVGNGEAKSADPAMSLVKLEKCETDIMRPRFWA